MGGGVIPVSAVLADKDVMLCIRPGEHGRFVVIPSNPHLMVSLSSLNSILSKRFGGFSFMICVTVSLQKLLIFHFNSVFNAKSFFWIPLLIVIQLFCSAKAHCTLIVVCFQHLWGKSLGQCSGHCLTRCNPGGETC